MRKKLQILIFSKMAPTILIKFSGFIVHSKHNNMTLLAFPRKIPEIGKYIFNSFPSPKAGPKPNHQSHSTSTSMFLSQISRTHFLSFHPNPKIKSSSHKKKIKNLDFLINGSNGFH